MRPRFEAVQTLSDVREEARLRLLTIGENVDAGLSLPAHAIEHRPLHALLVRRGWAIADHLRPHQIEQTRRARQTADVGCENPTGARLAVHEAGVYSREP